MAKRTKIGRAANRTPGISISDPKFFRHSARRWEARGQVPSLACAFTIQPGWSLPTRLRVRTQTKLVSRTIPI
jgi:hypothetical protein